MIQYAVRRYFCKFSFFNAMSRNVDQMLTEIFVIIFLLLSLAFSIRFSTVIISLGYM